MKKLTTVLMFAALSVFAFTSCEEDEPATVEVQSVTLDKPSVTLSVGETATLKATVMPENASNKSVTWASSNPEVATVSGGVVTAVAPGSATVTATAGDKKASCSVTVSKPADIPVAEVSLDLPTAQLEIGQSVTLTATVKPDNATDKTVTWASSNTAVATVDGGKVKAVGEGTANITATAGGKTAACVVTVTKPVVPVSGISLDFPSATVAVGSTVTLTATVEPANATDKTVTWSSSNSAVASVAGGVVTAVAVGTATITAKAGQFTATCEITVIADAVAVTGVTLDKNELTVKPGESVTLVATVNPTNASNKAVKWYTTDPEIATVSAGVVEGVTPGEVVVTVETVDGGFKATCVVTVSKDGSGADLPGLPDDDGNIDWN